MTAPLMSVMQAPQHPHPRSSPDSRSADPSGFFSLSISLKQREAVRLCKTNCKSIEVAILYPLSHFPSSPSCKSLDEEDGSADLLRSNQKESADESGTLERPEKNPGRLAAMSADQEHPEISPIIGLSHDSSEPPSTTATTTSATFPLMSLPLELRLKIYGYLLPARTHTIVTQLPHNGYFYNSLTVPVHSAQSFYPFGTHAPNNLTTYKVLSSNFRTSYPSPSIYPEILCVSKQVQEEAEPVLYGNSETVWDFGIHLEALKAFWGDRSKEARGYVRGVRVAREIMEGRGEVDPRWVDVCEFLGRELTGLRVLDLTIWSASGETTSFPLLTTAAASGDGDAGMDWEAEWKVKKEELRRWREWEWTRDLLKMDALRQARITWWGFENVRGVNAEGSFDSWLAGRMVGDRVVRERMVGEGGVEEGFVVLRVGE